MGATVRYDVLENDWGAFLLVINKDGALTRLEYQQNGSGMPLLTHGIRDEAALAPVRRTLTAYLNGERPAWPLPLAPRGTMFQQTVWAALAGVGYGETISYQDLARAIGRPTAVRAVAGALARNPIEIAIPCHRIIGKNGDLRGYAGGLAQKKRLLDLEKDHLWMETI
jgi:methylated-DNA-[protein]-cysteine S-methyltransferase